ncbi:MAG: gamma-butyrobetaine hydroxylase-like domain-containing protein, partial [Myxococcota bacterium]
YQEVGKGRGLVLEHAEPVGNYGMKLFWGDGHDTGIYDFEELRNICPCTTCDPEQTRIAERVRPRYK